METHRSIVIVPSRTIDKFHEAAAETQAYEERLLCLLLMLRDPQLRVVYVTSSPVVDGADPALAYLGTESGSRELFARAGVPHPLGVERITGRADAVAAIARLRSLRPHLEQVVVKLDAGVSGEGNAIVELGGLPRPGTRGEARRIGERLDAMALEAVGVSPALYLERLSHGGVVEERILGCEVRSPSVQLELTADGEARIVSTHDQILSGRRYRRSSCSQAAPTTPTPPCS